MDRDNKIILTLVVLLIAMMLACAYAAGADEMRKEMLLNGYRKVAEVAH